MLAELLSDLAALARIPQQLAAIQRSLTQMATKADFDQLLAAFNEETNQIAARIDTLAAAVAAKQSGDGSISSEDAAVILTEFGTLSDRLRLLASNPSDPIPQAA